MAETVSEETAAQENKTEATQSAKEHGKLSVLDHVFSWRGMIYFLLHFTFIAWCIPRSATSMAFVCMRSRRAELLTKHNATGISLGELRSQAHGNSNLTSGYKVSQSDLQVLQDIDWDSDTEGLVLAGPLMLAFIGPVLFDAVIQRVGARSVLTWNQLANAVLMFSAPSLARVSPYLMLANHIILGLTMASWCFFPPD
ncbi:sialin [Elysia marginata]|uniref:Sialin n=1 Tax=Elysia marginata TaxID=1093978 RepID=A0AAV4HHY9_9GAST|nr:sialin [Elysia marginata]